MSCCSRFQLKLLIKLANVDRQSFFPIESKLIEVIISLKPDTSKYYNSSMISEIIIVGISVKLLLVLLVWVSTVGLSTLAKRAKHKLFGGADEDKVVLTQSLILQYQHKLAMEATIVNKSESIDIDATRNSPVAMQGLQIFFYSLKKMMKNKRRRNGTKSSSLPLLPVRSEPFPDLSESPKAKMPISLEFDQDKLLGTPSVPHSTPRPANSILDLKGFAQISGSANRKREELVRKAQDSYRSSSKPSNRVARSKLAAKLEKKLLSLNHDIDLAQSISKLDILAFKIQRLSLIHNRKMSNKGGQILIPIVEDLCN